MAAGFYSVEDDQSTYWPVVKEQAYRISTGHWVAHVGSLVGYTKLDRRYSWFVWQPGNSFYWMVRPQPAADGRPDNLSIGK